ncbi:hypothetical protein J1605_019104 [Eschrichtius robustus]|uniref:Uncharacterized protein n=1 Tax=Eschrichtius robustus TaxID=9764 RepID=A0AB34HRD2_ESCRO|nr:hypothetical protein J1605_019104 [Eschrichtius robustus]
MLVFGESGEEQCGGWHRSDCRQDEKEDQARQEEMSCRAGSALLRQRGASLVAQWLRIRLPMQGTWVRALVREDPTCRGATKPVRHNY